MPARPIAITFLPNRHGRLLTPMMCASNRPWLRHLKRHQGRAFVGVCSVGVWLVREVHEGYPLDSGIGRCVRG